MKRVLAVVLIAALTTMMLGIDRTSWAGQAGDEKKADKQRAAVTKALSRMGRGSTATIELKIGEKFDGVIEEITDDNVAVLRQDRDTVSTQTIPIAQIASVKKTSVRKMGMASKILIGTAVALGVLIVAGLSTCSVSPAAQPGPGDARATTR